MPHTRTPLLVLLLASLFAPAFSVSIADHHKDLVSRIEAGNHRSAIEVLEVIEAQDQGQIFSANNYPYLAGRLFERMGDAGTAARRYLDAADEGSALEVYALWRLSKLMRRSGNLPAERLFLLDALSLSTESAPSYASGERLARSWFESGNHDLAIHSVRNRWHGSESDPSREDLVLIGKAARLSGDARTASESFKRVLKTTPDPAQPDDLALAAVEGLDLLAVDEEEFGSRVLDLATEEHFERANVFQHNRRFRLARLHFRALVERFPGDPRAPESAYQIGRGFAQERDYQHAIEWFERVLEQFPESEQADQALYQAANAYAALGKPKESVTRFRRFIEQNTDSQRTADAYLNLIDIHRDNADSVLALKTADEMVARFPSGEEKAAALFARARTHIAQEDWNSALTDLKTLESMGFGTDVAGEEDFLKGYVLEKLGRRPEAAEAYLGIRYGFRSFYGSLATERLRSISKVSDKGLKARLASFAVPKDGSPESLVEAAEAAFQLASDEESLGPALNRLKEAYSRIDEFEAPEAPQVKIPGRKEIRQRPAAIGSPGHEDLADELLFLGLYDEGSVEYELHLLDDGSADEEAETLAELYRRGGLVTRSVALAESRWREMPANFVAEAMPEGELRLLYPVPFKHEVLKYSRAEGIDPSFVLSIMRQESRFDPGVKSSAAARGLMQFIPSTGSKMAEEIGIRDFTQDDLYDPAGAVRIGSRYLAKLFRDFPNQPAAVAASYNAGEDRMVRWYSRAGSSEPARYIPEIRFSQTRDYVAKVMNNYRIYRMLYDENLEEIGR
ncbi:MAG: transglycosylase SLT domain-containing protein [Acidobacteriota bacterium]|nr:MAG: transglycosylase SLT domain-containing protein [Acidobacteriota bacterium]